MKRTISTTELKKSVGEIVSSVRLRGDSYIIEQRGKEGAALVPLSVLRAYERGRRQTVEIMDSVAQANDMSEADAMRLALEEVAAVRKSKRKREALSGKKSTKRKSGGARGK